jgi:CheY-like chemotaxis protein
MNDRGLAQTLDRANSELVPIANDVPDHLSGRHGARDESGSIVLLGAAMPGMDGFGVARRLQADASRAHIAFICMTGLSETEHLERVFAKLGDETRSAAAAI